MKGVAGFLHRLRGAPDVVVPLHLIQDLDLALPVMEALLERGARVQPWCSETLLKKSPRVEAALRERGWGWRALTFEEACQTPIPWGVKAVLTAVETNLGPHRFSRVISERAVKQGRFVATMQHGLENVGLTYHDAIHPAEGINFAAHRIYTWGPLSALLPGVPASVRERCVPMGCPKPIVGSCVDFSRILPGVGPVVGVFENLHWHRYNDAYREAFIAMVLQAAIALPDVLILIKPHHAGMWLARQPVAREQWPENIVLADPGDPFWEKHTASQIMPRLSAVITTPSTVALDAARARVPVAVFGGDLSLPGYEPLTIIREVVGLVGFLDAALQEGEGCQGAAAQAWLERVLIPGDGAQRIAEDVLVQIS